jgi:hypothetical protein
VSFMITLWAGSLPPVLERLPDAQLRHLAVFTSRSREEGRERFRLHVGYFDDLSAAEPILDRVRQWYPSAWAVPAERHTALARLPALAALGPSLPVPPVPPDREAVACGALAIDPIGPPDAAPVPLFMHDSVDSPVAAPCPLTPRQTLTLLEEPAVREPAVAEPAVPEPAVAEPVVPEQAVAEPVVPEPAAPTFRDGGHARAPLEVSEWRAAAPKTSSKPKATSWLKRLTA